MRLRTFLSFLLGFSLEVNVKAAESLITLPLTQAPAQLPSDCLKTGDVCSVGVPKNTRFVFNETGMRLVAGSKSILIKKSEGVYSLVEGAFYLQSKNQVRLDFLNGSIEPSSNDEVEAYFHVTNKNTNVHVLKGQLQILPTGHSSPVVMRAGFQNTFGKVNTSGLSSVSLPQPFELSILNKEIPKLYPDGRESFKELFSFATKRREDAVRETAQIHSRMVANEQERQRIEEAEAIRKKNAWKQERDSLRKLLWDRTFE